MYVAPESTYLRAPEELWEPPQLVRSTKKIYCPLKLFRGSAVALDAAYTCVYTRIPYLLGNSGSISNYIYEDSYFLRCCYCTSSRVAAYKYVQNAFRLRGAPQNLSRWIAQLLETLKMPGLVLKLLLSSAGEPFDCDILYNYHTI